MKKKFVLILALLIIVFAISFSFSACSSQGKVNYKEAIIFVTELRYPYIFRSYTIDANGIMTIDAYKYHYSYEASIENAEAVRIITHVSNVTIVSEDEIDGWSY